jgi:hypothetical protein
MLPPPVDRIRVLAAAFEGSGAGGEVRSLRADIAALASHF